VLEALRLWLPQSLCCLLSEPVLHCAIDGYAGG